MYPLGGQAHEHVDRDNGQGQGYGEKKSEDASSGNHPATNQFGGVDAYVIERYFVVTLAGFVAHPTLRCLE